MVKKDDLLAVIDPRPYQAALLQAQGQLARDQAQLTNARLDLDRYRTAVREHAIPEQQVATQEAVVSADEGAVKFDQGTVEAAQVNLDYTRITSPINGRAGLRMVDAGNNVAANGTSGLVLLTQLQPITVVFPLAQDYLSQVLTEMKNGQSLRVEAFDRSHPNAVAQGELATIDNQVDPATGTFRLKGTFKNENTALWPGEFVSLRFIVSVRKNALTVPTRSVQRGPKGNYLFVVKADSTVEMRNIDVAQTDQDVAVITKGLNAGEKIVVDGQYRLEQGTKVALQTPQAGDKS
jgi:multidrug efflux system membrane fusion protein